VPSKDRAIETGGHSEFARRYNGYLHGILRWPDLAALWERIRAAPEQWYVVQVGEPLPLDPVPPEKLKHLVAELDALLRRDHEEDYCGIVYVDDPEQPALVKIFDPHHLGSSCGSSGQVVPPRWVLSRFPPEPIFAQPLPSAARRRWWQTLFGKGL